MHDRGVKCGQKPRRRTDEDKVREREREREGGGKTVFRERVAQEDNGTYAKMGRSYFGWE